MNLRASGWPRHDRAPSGQGPRSMHSRRSAAAQLPEGPPPNGLTPAVHRRCRWKCPLLFAFQTPTPTPTPTPPTDKKPSGSGDSHVRWQQRVEDVSSSGCLPVGWAPGVGAWGGRRWKPIVRRAPDQIFSPAIPWPRRYSDMVLALRGPTMRRLETRPVTQTAPDESQRHSDTVCVAN